MAGLIFYYLYCVDVYWIFFILHTYEEKILLSITVPVVQTSYVI